jgi:hypothetical protein
MTVKDHEPQVKNADRYEDLRRKGMSKERAARIANIPNVSRRGGHYIERQERK